MNNKFFLQVEEKYKLYDLHIKDFYQVLGKKPKKLYY